MRSPKLLPLIAKGGGITVSARTDDFGIMDWAHPPIISQLTDSTIPGDF